MERRRQRELAALGQQRPQARKVDLEEDEGQGADPAAYSEAHLSGMKIGHDIDDFVEGDEGHILVLEDRNILDDAVAADGDDVLVSVALQDEERLKRNIRNRKIKPGYTGYDDNEFGADNNPLQKRILAQYDEEIDGETRKGFVLGVQGQVSVTATKQGDREAMQQEIGEKLKMTAWSLDYNKMQQVRDYYTKEEEDVLFKKTSKSGKKRKTRQRSDVGVVDVGVPEEARGNSPAGHGKCVVCR